MINLTLSLLAVLLPVAWEVWNDRNGDFDKVRDVLVRAVLCLYSGILLYFIEDFRFLFGALLAASVHFLLFDYIIVYVLKRRKIIDQNAKVFSYLGKTSELDGNSVWIRLGPWGRLITRLAFFIPTLIICLKL